MASHARTNSTVYNEGDMMYRLVETWYDSTWSYLMSPNHMVKRVDNHRKEVSDTASVASSTLGEGSVVGKMINEKLDTLQYLLTNVHENLRYGEFKALCDVCLKCSDRLYPGFKDLLLIARFLLREDAAYRDKLTPSEIEKITLPMVYQSIYYEFCSFLLRTTLGSEAMKLLVTATRTKHATYEICRQKFCRILVEETDIVHYGLIRLIKKIIKHRTKAATKTTTKPLLVPDVAMEFADDEDDKEIEAPVEQPREETIPFNAHDDDDTVSSLEDDD